MRRTGRSIVVLAALTAVVAVGISFAHRPACWSGSGPATAHVHCVDDLFSLYGLRQLPTHAFPYLHPGPFDLPRGTVEYPPLTAVFAWLTALPVHSATGFLVLSSVVLALVAAATAGALGRVVAPRALLFAASPTLALYAAHNWDVLPVAATVAGVLAWRKDRPALAAAMFAIGTCLKVYPALFMLPLLADLRFRKRARQGATVAAYAGVAAAVNVPFLLAAPHQWLQVLTYQAARPIDESAMSLWSAFGTGLPLPLVNFCALALLVVGTVTVLYAASRIAADRGDYPMVQACAALVCMFIVVGKVGSPQYLLWLAPFFALLNVPLRWWVLVEIVDVGSWFAIWRVYGGPSLGVLTGSPHQVAAAVASRAAVLAAASWALLRTKGMKPASVDLTHRQVLVIRGFEEPPWPRPTSSTPSALPSESGAVGSRRLTRLISVRMS